MVRASRVDRVRWRDGRAVEGARLESVYTVKSGIEGSNPSPSASDYSRRSDQDRESAENRHLSRRHCPKWSAGHDGIRREVLDRVLGWR